MPSTLTFKLRATFFLMALSLLPCSHALAQRNVIDFNQNHHQFTTFGGATFQRVSDPTQAGNTIGQLVNSGAVWEGVYIDLPVALYLDSSRVLQIRVYSNDMASHNMICKLEAGVNAPIEVQRSFSGMGWHSLSFDFSQARFSGGTTPTVGSKHYKRMALFVDGPNAVPGTYGLDDIVFPDFASAYPFAENYNHLVWADEFNGNGAVDPADWFQEVVPPNAWGWHNGEFQHYTNRVDNSFESNGHLHIVAKRENYTAYGLTLDYTSARLNSNFSFTYGRVDVRAKLPFGSGTWPAIWMLGTSIGNNVHPFTMPWPDCGEIDIMEHWGYEQDRIHSSLHTLSSHGSTVNTAALFEGAVSDSFHVYSVHWSPERIAFLLDGDLHYVYEPAVKNAATWPFNSPQFIILNIAMGGSWFNVDPSFTQSEMLIDYVRVFQDSAATVGTTDPTLHSGLRIFPQPASNVLYVEGKALKRIQLIDALGRLVIDEPLSGSQSERLLLKNLPEGMYAFLILDDGQWQTGKLLIDRR